MTVTLVSPGAERSARQAACLADTACFPRPLPQEAWQLLSRSHNDGVMTVGITTHRIREGFTDAFRREMEDLSVTGPVVLDFGEIHHFTSDVVTILEQFAAKVAAAGGRLLFAGMNDGGREMLRLCAPRLFAGSDFFDSVSAATASLAARQSRVE